ncbi:MAG: hypothetical protein ACRDD0_09160, partial [Bacteroidales bacterium]
MRNVRNNLAIIASSILLTTSSFSVVYAQNDINPVRKFENLPTYNKADLGCTIDNRGYTFKIWSPLAEAARVHIYEQGRGGKPVKNYNLHLDPATGVWAYTSQEDLMN